MASGEAAVFLRELQNSRDNGVRSYNYLLILHGCARAHWGFAGAGAGAAASLRAAAARPDAGRGHCCPLTVWSSHTCTPLPPRRPVQRGRPVRLAFRSATSPPGFAAPPPDPRRRRVHRYTTAVVVGRGQPHRSVPFPSLSLSPPPFVAFVRP
jgi:hypothetical protein